MADAAHDGSLFALNLITAGMDVIGILVALAFTYRWGERLPAWLVLFPMWVAAGFLAPIVVAMPNPHRTRTAYSHRGCGPWSTRDSPGRASR